MSNETDEKACPFCAERILAAARKCKHCGEFLDSETRTQAQTQKSAQLIEQTGKEWRIASALFLSCFLPSPGLRYRATMRCQSSGLDVFYTLAGRPELGGITGNTL